MNTQHLNKEQKVSKLYFIAGRYKNLNYNTFQWKR